MRELNKIPLEDTFFDSLRKPSGFAFNEKLFIGMTFFLCLSIQHIWYKTHPVTIEVPVKIPIPVKLPVGENISNIGTAYQNEEKGERVEELVKGLKALLEVVKEDSIKIKSLEKKLFDKPYKVGIVISDRAHLFKEPDTKSKKIGNVEKGIELVITNRKDNWYRTFSPKGDTTWIEASHISMKENDGTE